MLSAMHGDFLHCVFLTFSEIRNRRHYLLIDLCVYIYVPYIIIRVGKYKLLIEVEVF